MAGGKTHRNFAELMKFRNFIVFPVILMWTVAAGQTITVSQYIETFQDIAMKEMIEHKIPASITLAQGLLESGSGNSRLAKQGNNHFGIKCKRDWTGCTILEDDDALQECFRCYNNAEESYKDHSLFLRNNKRYADLFGLDIADYKGWARGLLAAGYATNRKYADLLIGTIERNRLMRFDSMVLSGYNPFSEEIKPRFETVYNKVPSTVVQKNQDLKAIAQTNGKSEKRLIRINDLDHHKKIEPGDVLYLRPKKRKAGVPSHTVREGESMWEISQMYAIRIHSLYKKNLMEPGTEPVPGVVLQLRNKADFRPDTGRAVNAEQRTNVLTADRHTVSKGETLYSIARIYGITVDNLKTANGLNSDQIREGMILKIHRSGNQEGSSVLTHTVVNGETLYSIARKYGVQVDQIKTWNKLVSDSISAGQKLEIRAPR